MPVLGPILACLAIVVVARSLLKGWYPHAVLLVAGLLMLGSASVIGLELPALERPTGLVVFDLFRFVAESFSGTLAGVGLMIMAIGGFVAYMDHIGASGALVRLATRPLQWFSRFPYATSALLIPLGQVLFVCIPSAAGLSLLLMASVFPLIVRLGVSRLSAVSVIVACTSFGIGPASAISVRATQIVGTSPIAFFFSSQLPMVLPLSGVMALAYFFVNRHFDRKRVEEEAEASEADAKAQVAAPGLYAIFPVLPLALLLLFSELFDLMPARLDTTTAMFVSMVVAAVVHGLRVRNPRDTMESLKVVWAGMANIFKSVVTLIVAADMFSKGLIGLGFIQALLGISAQVGLGAAGIGVVMTTLIFMASMLMGSGNASFFAFGPLVPRIAEGLGAPVAKLILPMQLAASLGRGASPIAGVVIATAQIGGVSPLDIARRNLIPLGCCLGVMLVLQFALP